MEVKFYYWEDCPSYPGALERLEKLMRAMRIADPVNRVEINTDEEAARCAFPGSPTIRINGADIDPDGAAEMRVGLSCRIYHEGDGRVTPIPPEAMIRAALERTIDGEESP